MKYFLTTELPRLAAWGTAYADGLARAEEDYYSALERRKNFAPRQPTEATEATWEAANRRRVEAEARQAVWTLKLIDPAAFDDLDRELPLRAFLRRQWYPPSPGEFLASFEELLPIASTVGPGQIRHAGDISVLDTDRQPSQPIPIACGTAGELTANQQVLFARLVREEGAIEKQLIDAISLWYLDQAEYVGEDMFGRRPGETVYLPGDPCEDDFRKLAMIWEIQLAPSTCRLAVVFQVPFHIDFEHGSLATALVDEFEYVHLGGVDELVWLV
jgi:hypothetical protein